MLPVVQQPRTWSEQCADVPVELPDTVLVPVFQFAITVHCLHPAGISAVQCRVREPKNVQAVLFWAL